MFLAFLDALAGDAEAEKTLVQGIRYAEANEFTWDVIGGRSLLAQLLQRRGDIGGARLEFERLRAIARDAGNSMVEADCDSALRAMASLPSERSARRFVAAPRECSRSGGAFLRNRPAR